MSPPPQLQISHPFGGLTYCRCTIRPHYSIPSGKTCVQSHQTQNCSWSFTTEKRKRKIWFTAEQLLSKASLLYSFSSLNYSSIKLAWAIQLLVRLPLTHLFFFSKAFSMIIISWYSMKVKIMVIWWNSWWHWKSCMFFLWKVFQVK